MEEHKVGRIGHPSSSCGGTLENPDELSALHPQLTWFRKIRAQQMGKLFQRGSR